MTTPLRITRRRLPHWALEGRIYFVTFRLSREPLTSAEVRLVRNHIIAGHNQFYDLLAVTVMPDHVHLLLRPKQGKTLSQVMKGIKGVAAWRLNADRGRKGSVWQDESFDRIVRDQAELLEKLQYMFLNPVKVGLTDRPWEYEGWFLSEELPGGQTGMSAPPDQTGGLPSKKPQPCDDD